MNKLRDILALTAADMETGPVLTLAPMAGITDWSMRLLAERRGCDAATTEMISAQGFIYARRSRGSYQRLIARAPYEKPLCIQLFGREPEYIAEAARILSGMQRYVCIDLNMGCPAKKVTSGGSGSALMKDERLAGQVIAAAVKSSLLPVSVKMRLGWDEEHINAVRIAKIAEEEGAAFVTVHGRTTRQQYSGRADWQRIAEVKAALAIPVIANGDITDGSSALSALRVTGADGLAIGRAALGNPWVFRDIRCALNGEPCLPPSPSERVAEAADHTRCLRAALPEKRAILEMRKFYAWYIKGLRGAAEARTKINTAGSFDEISAILDELLRQNEQDESSGTR